MTNNIARAIAVANSIFSDRFPGADYAFVAGPLISGAKYPGSRSEMFVVYRALPSAYRESFTVAGLSVDVFVHDPATLARLADEEVALGHYMTLATIAQAQVIGRRIPVGRIVQSKMTTRLEQGPPPLTQEQLEDLRFEVTKSMEALKIMVRPDQAIGIAVSLYPKLAELSLRTRGHWMGTGPWARPLLDEVEPGLGTRFDQAFAQLMGATKADLALALAADELARAGGALVAEYRREGLA